MNSDVALELSIEQLLGALSKKLSLECTRIQVEFPSKSRTSVATLIAEVNGLEKHARDVLDEAIFMRNSLWPIDHLPSTGSRDGLIGNRQIAEPVSPASARKSGAQAPVWEHLTACSLSADECASCATAYTSLIKAILCDHDEAGSIEYLDVDGGQSFANAMDKALDKLAPWLQKKCLHVLREVCGHGDLLPSSVRIPVCYNRSDTPLYRSGHADVWKVKHQGRYVAVKEPRIYSTIEFKKMTSRFCKEVVTWKTLRHPNVLPLLGVTMENSGFAMASEWMANGNINEFVEADPGANRVELLKDAAKGLTYMHGLGITHGNLKGANILVDQSNRALLAGFGSLAISSDTHSAPFSPGTDAGATRWMSPELLYPEYFGFTDSQPTKQSDYYALGMVILEVLSGEAPFGHLGDVLVTGRVIVGERPTRPEEGWFTDDLWETLKQCWSPRPKGRPTVEAILECLERVSMTLRQLPASEVPLLGAADDQPHLHHQMMCTSSGRHGTSSSAIKFGTSGGSTMGKNNASSPPPTPSTSTAPYGPGGGIGTSLLNMGASAFVPKKSITIKNQEARELNLDAYRRKDAPASPIVESNSRLFNQTHKKRASVRIETSEARVKRLAEEKEEERIERERIRKEEERARKEEEEDQEDVEEEDEDEERIRKGEDDRIRNNIPVAPPSALARARIIEDLDRISYPEGISSPKPELNVNSKKGKFRYDREFLLQFMVICNERPDVPLDVIGLEAANDQQHSHYPITRHRASSAAMPPPLSRQAPVSGFKCKSWADDEQSVKREVKALLNKLTTGKFDSISDQIIAWANKSEMEKDGRTLIHVVRLIFKKATDEAASSEMWARLCRKMMETISPNVQDNGIRNTDGKPIAGGQLFRKYLLNRCQEDFERGWAAKDAAASAAAAKASEDAAVKKAAEASGEAELYSDEYYAAQKAKRRGLGLIQFIGELYKLQMLTERIMHECIKKLLGNVDDPEEAEIESLCRLLTTVGRLLDNVKARAHMDIYFTRMKELGKSNNVAPHMQFTLQDLIELRERKWIPRNQIAAPTTIAQVHEEAAKQRAQAENNAANRTDRWSIASGSTTRPLPKAGDLSNFGKINKSGPVVMGPSSVWAGKKDAAKRDSTLTRVNSSSNMFMMLGRDSEAMPETGSKPSRPSSRRTSVDLGVGGATEPQRRKLQVLPRWKPVEEENKANGGSPDRSEDEGGDWGLAAHSQI